ncbi:MAG TPA: TrmH family RNA methyltransferase [Vicinamibacterales bacterium]|nr:TrmH family RNA methyltransferase [Vicinamibacterales bacterium]
MNVQATMSTVDSSRPSLHVVFVHPEIHCNTGNAGRTCLAAGATLHLIEPLGFSLDSVTCGVQLSTIGRTSTRRVWPDWTSFEAVLPALGEPYFFSTKATCLLWDAPLVAPERAVLIFGRETAGLPGNFTSDIAIGSSRSRC